MLSNRKNKKAQVGETITWIVATLIIIGILLIFIYASVAMAKAKSIKSSEISNQVSSQINSGDIGWVEVKNNMAFSREGSNKDRIEGWINEKQES